MVNEPLIATTLRITPSLKEAAEYAAAAEGRSFSNFVCQAVAEKLTTQPPVPDVTGVSQSYVVMVSFEFPNRNAALALAQVATAKVSNAVHDTGAKNVSASLALVVPHDRPIASN